MRPSALAANFTHRLLLNRIAFPKVEQADIVSDVGNQAWPKPCSSMEISNVINILSKRGYFLIEETINVRVFRDAFNAILKFFDLFSSYISCQMKNIYIILE